MPNDPMSASSGDLLADRRFAWGERAAREGDHTAAADLFRQTLELAPEWAPAWLALGDALAKSGDRDGAVKAYRGASRRDPAGALGAQLRLAALGAAAAPATAAPGYVRALFDQYAQRFDEHLRALDYQGPELLAAAIERACAARGREHRFDRGFDLGCGTGLMAKALWPRVDSLVGVDLSPKMIEFAQMTGLYNHLAASDLIAFLDREHAGSSDLCVAADVFVYIGDLAPAVSRCARVLEDGGLLAFSVQRCEGTDWRLGADLRYAHSAGYLERLAAAHGFEITVLDVASTRKDRGEDVPGLICVMARQ